MAVLQSQLRLTLHDGISRGIRGITSQLSAFQQRQRMMLAPMTGMVGRIAAIGGAYIGASAGIRGTAGAAIRFEEAFAGVGKVLDVSDEQLQNIRRQITGMSRELPITAEGIASIYAAAGQANIPVAELRKFSEMVAKTSTAWEIPVAETGQALAEIKNQLSLGVSELGLFADAINHISNNSAARAPDLVDFSKRVAAQGEMFGYTATESLAFGGAMIAVGAQSEVASTSFRNMGNALTVGTNATSRHTAAFKRLGLDAVRTAKSMQKNALKTTLEVIEKIQALPEWERISVARQMFGDEARSLMPLINNSTELRRQMELVGDETNYAGSAFAEYVKRADTVANVLAILQNKFRDTFRGIGDRMLPGIKEAALAIGDVMDTMGDRVTPFKQLRAAITGFVQGFAGEGGIRGLVNDFADLFGEIDPANGADRLGQLFQKFKEWGASLREFNAALRDNPIAQFLKDMAGNGLRFVIAAAGIGLLASAIGKLGKAMWVLSGASMAFGMLKWLAKFRMPSVPDLSKPGEKAKPGAPAKGGGGVLGFLGKLSPFAAALLTGGSTPDNDYRSAPADERARMREDAQTDAVTHAKGYDRSGPRNPRRGLGDVNGVRRAMQEFGGNIGPAVTTAPDGSTMLPPIQAVPQRGELPAILKTQSVGTSDVNITNPPPRPNIVINAPVTVTTNADPQAIGRAVGSEVSKAAEGYMADGPY